LEAFSHGEPAHRLDCPDQEVSTMKTATDMKPLAKPRRVTWSGQPRNAKA